MEGHADATPRGGLGEVKVVGSRWWADARNKLCLASTRVRCHPFNHSDKIHFYQVFFRTDERRLPLLAPITAYFILF